MKKILPLLILIIIVSCQKKELPSDLVSALSNCEAEYNLKNKFENVIIGLDDAEINQLSIDSLGSIISTQKTTCQILEINERELNQILKKNPEFSNTEEIKNRKKYSTSIEFFKKFNLILEMYNAKKVENM